MTNYRRRRAKPKDTKKRFNINERIRADEIRLISEDGEMIGVMSLKAALDMAEEKTMDLIEINPKANPPIIKLMSYSKFKYVQDKAEKNKVKTNNETKTLRVSVRISIHDLKVQAKKADQFLSKGNKVKLQVQMRGREKAHPEVARETMDQFLSLIEGEFSVENDPKQVGDSCYSLLKPTHTAK